MIPIRVVVVVVVVVEVVVLNSRHVNDCMPAAGLFCASG